MNCLVVLGGRRVETAVASPIVPPDCPHIAREMEVVLAWANERGNPVLASQDCSHGLQFCSEVLQVFMIGVVDGDFMSMLTTARINGPQRFRLISGACLWRGYTPEDLNDRVKYLAIHRIFQVSSTLEEYLNRTAQVH